MKSLRSIFDALVDLTILILPQTRPLSGFAFLVHPRNLNDVFRKYHFLRHLPPSAVKFFLRHFWPITVSHVGGVRRENDLNDIPGWIISIPITADQMMADRNLAKEFIIKAAKLGQKRGAGIIGLGALTASLTKGGTEITPHVEAGITTGRLYTAKIIVDMTEQAQERLSLPKNKIQVAVVGAVGSIGTASSQLLALKGYERILLVDVEKRRADLEELQKLILSNNKNIEVKISTEIKDILTAHIIITATNHPDTLITSSILRQGAVIVDDAQPSDVDPSVITERPDVLVLEGGVTHAKGVEPNFRFGLQHPEDVFSCLAEVILLSHMNHKGDFQVGKIFDVDMNALTRLEEQSRTLGFRVGEFQNFVKVYSEADIAYVRGQISDANEFK